ncbi:STAS domain-containing protein [Streptomyces sp. NPDC048606]|uniref:STAS domain-containing protein n=1 Tax=Streptomyces sp. NPDC048606 TaxID=3154726 RepID=UPI00341451D9
MTEHVPSADARPDEIAVEVMEHAITIRPVGEIAIGTAPALRLALSEAIRRASATRPVTVDCTSLTFCDSSALNILLAARHTARELGILIRLAAPSPSFNASCRSPERKPSSPSSNRRNAAELIPVVRSDHLRSRSRDVRRHHPRCGGVQRDFDFALFTAIPPSPSAIQGPHPPCSRAARSRTMSRTASELLPVDTAHELGSARHLRTEEGG